MGNLCRCRGAMVPASAMHASHPHRLCCLTVLLSAAATLTLSACSDPVEFTTPGRAPPEAGDLVVTIDETPRGFGKASLVKDGTGKPLVLARIAETATEARINVPTEASTVTCSDMPQAIILTTSSPLEHANTTYFEMRWLATECSITVSRIDATATQVVEGSFSGTLVREKDEISDGREVQGPKTLKVSGSFVVANK